MRTTESVRLALLDRLDRNAGMYEDVMDDLTDAIGALEIIRRGADANGPLDKKGLQAIARKVLSRRPDAG